MLTKDVKLNQEDNDDDCNFNDVLVVNVRCEYYSSLYLNRYFLLHVVKSPIYISKQKYN